MAALAGVRLLPQLQRTRLILQRFLEAVMAAVIILSVVAYGTLLAASAGLAVTLIWCWHE